MARFQAIQPEQATGKARELLDDVQKALGRTPNMMRTMANAPAVLEAFWGFAGAISHGRLPALLRTQLAIAVAKVNDCNYCASAHSIAGAQSGLDEAELRRNMDGRSNDSKTEAALQFARSAVLNHGRLPDAHLAKVRAAGWSDEEILEVFAIVALNNFTNTFNLFAQTDLDFPDAEITRLVLAA